MTDASDAAKGREDLAASRDVLKRPKELPLIFPSILGADFMKMGRACEEALDEGADGLHVDVMDGHFVPNLTMGTDMVKALRSRFPQTYLDVHLMVERPSEYVEAFAEAGADCLTFHIEATVGRMNNNQHHLIQQIRKLDCDVGVAINPPTPGEVISTILDEVDMVLVMSVHPGFAGQKFISGVIPKVKVLRALMRDDQRLEMDGGINDSSAAACRAAGCDVIVAASAVFNSENQRKTIRKLRGEDVD